jgi:glycosyltransferase involved in cell wall biosynthesis
MNDVGVIAIGRNEGERLRRCLASVTGRGLPVVYVDSASTDGSAELARSVGAEVVALDMSRPFSAARARNEGFERLMHVAPATRLVQFVDGDCEVVDGWIRRAARELEARADVAVVCGRRRERFPEKSVYNRLADVEWDTPVGEAKSCGGDAMMRVEAFRSVGGFDPSVVAGEEPELCQRLREKGHKVVRVDAEMTLHDSDILRFGQWWKRAVRSGYGGLDVASRFGRGNDGLFVRQVRSARVWGLGWPACVVLGGGIAGAVAGPFAAVTVALLVALALPLQMARLALRFRRRVWDWPTAAGYGVLTMLGKWASLVGQVRYLRDRSAGRHARLIEYKGCATPITKPT